MSELPRWSLAGMWPSYEAREFTDALERVGAETRRLEALFDEHDIRNTPTRPVTAADGDHADAVIGAYNSWQTEMQPVSTYLHALVTTDSFDDTAKSLANEVAVFAAAGAPLLARLVEWLTALGVDELATVSAEVGEHSEPLRRLVERADHQMPEREEHLYAELSTAASGGWRQLAADVTSQLTGEVAMPDGTIERLPMAAVRGLGSHADEAVRKAAFAAELAAWPNVALSCAAALNGIKGEACIVNRRRSWSSPLEASLYANAVSRPTFDAMQRAVVDSLADFRGWMRVKARLHGHAGALPWHDLVAPLPVAAPSIDWQQGIDTVEHAFASYSDSLLGLARRAVSEQWIDAEPRLGKRGGAYCASAGGDRSLVFLNWSASADSARTTAHELGHAYHNVQLAGRTPLQRRLPMALAETASIFCETLVVEEGLQRLRGADRLALLDVDLQAANQVVVDIHSRFLFESAVFARRERRTLGAAELDGLMVEAQSAAYGDGLDASTHHPHMWIVKPHYYNAHFYNWPYTYGLLFGLGLFARFQADPERFRVGYDDLLSRAGMSTAEALGRRFDLDVTDDGFWVASLDVLRARMAEYHELAAVVAP